MPSFLFASLGWRASSLLLSQSANIPSQFSASHMPSINNRFKNWDRPSNDLGKMMCEQHELRKITIHCYFNKNWQSNKEYYWLSERERERERGREGWRERAKVEFIKSRIGWSEKERDNEMTVISKQGSVALWYVHRTLWRPRDRKKYEEEKTNKSIVRDNFMNKIPAK